MNACEEFASISEQDWSIYTIKLAQLANERDKALNDKNYGKAIALHGQILDLKSELTIWLMDAYQ